MKIFKRIILALLLIFSFSFAVKAQDLSQIYSEQLRLSGAPKVFKSIPEDSKKHLKDLGITEPSWETIANLNPEKIFSGIAKMLAEKLTSPAKAFLPVVAILLLNIALKSITPPEKSSEMSRILGCISNLSLCVWVVNPVSAVVSSVCLVIKLAANFVLCLTPVMSAIMVASGQPVSALSYHTLIIFAGQVISRLSEGFFLPLVNTFLGISVICSICPRLNLSTLCKNAEKILKTVFEFFCTVFTSILALEQIVSSSADNLKSSVAKCMLGQCVPVVGTVVSDAYGAVQGSLRLLKSGVGTFGIAAGLIIFLPPLLECVLWVISLRFSACLADILKQEKISCLMKSVCGAMSITMAILVFCIIILIVSCAVTLILGR